jgi:hypothetical protein
MENHFPLLCGGKLGNNQMIVVFSVKLLALQQHTEYIREIAIKMNML